MDDQVKVLLKEYSVMREEIRLYINKYYIALTAILAIFTAGIFQNSHSKSNFVYIWIPYLVSGIFGFMTIVTFFINKMAGYVRLIESRINRFYKLEPLKTLLPEEKQNSKLPLLLWESYYADFGMNRDSGSQFSSLFGMGLFSFLLSVGVMLGIVILFGYEEAKRLEFKKPCLSISPATAFLLSSVLVVSYSIFAFWYVNTKTRDRTRKINTELLQKYDM